MEAAFGEALDYSLLTETLRVTRENGTPVPGTWQLGDGEKRGLFTPGETWQPGQYRLRPAARNQQWVRYGGDLLLVNTRNGRVLQVVRNRY